MIACKERFITCISIFLCCISLAQEKSVELHAHLFMKEGLDWYFRGDFFGPVQATHYTHGLRSQANPETVNASEIGILVATLYAHPLFVTDLKASIARQIELARRFVLENPQWVLARNPLEARQALQKRKQVMILALEGASGILETEEDLERWIDREGIRIVAPLHFWNDRIGGSALLKGWGAFLNPWSSLLSLFEPRGDGAVRVNRKGLTSAGKWLIQNLIDRGVWIDLAHFSDQSYFDALPMLQQARHPHLFTHTVLRQTHGAERGISLTQIQNVANTYGTIGLMASEQMLDGTPNYGVRCKTGCQCSGSVFALARQFSEVSKHLSPIKINLGTDYNGAVDHLRPACGTVLESEGLVHIGQQASVWEALRQVGAPVSSNLNKNIEEFLRTWEQARAKSRKPGSDTTAEPGS